MAVQGRFGGFEPYTLSGVRLREEELGRGSYAAVILLEYRALKCAGKRIYRVLYQQGVGDIVRRFENECRLLSQTRHPNIVQFLGVFFEEGSRVPILVMEFLPTTLADCIDRYSVLPPKISYSILHDVALGLYYLHSHSPPIIHRDLSANNVLLTDSMTAKISDLGVARIVNLNPLEITRLTGVPGTPAYMPPETFSANPRYNMSMDVFSFGIMLIHVFSGRWPFPLCDPTRPDPQNPTQVIGVTEADRRNEYLDQIGRGHPLMDQILRCISNNPGLRAGVQEIIRQLEAMVQQFQPAHANKIEMLQQQQSLRTEVERLVREVEQKDEEIEHLTQEGQRAREEVAQLNDALQTSQREAEQLTIEVENNQAEIRRNRAEHQIQIADLRRQKEAEATAKEAEITAKNQEIQHLRQEGQGAREEVAQLNDVLQTLQKESDRLASEVDEKQVEIAQSEAKYTAQIVDLRSQNEAEIAAKEAEFLSKVAELSAKDRELEAKDAILRRKDSELASKNAMLEHKSTAIRGLNDQLNTRGYLLSHLQPHPFHPQAEITWKKCTEFPADMNLARAVVANGKVHVGGGDCVNSPQAHQVFSYNPSEDVWSSLPDCPVRYFGMGQFEGRVVAIGGRKRSDDSDDSVDSDDDIEDKGEITNNVYVLDEDSHSWKDSIIPPMLTPCYSPAVLSHHSFLIVAGGFTPDGCNTAVELFMQDLSQWQKTCSLPFPCLGMSSVIIQNTVYLLGGSVGDGTFSNRVVYASVDSLLQKVLPPNQTFEVDSDSAWKTLPNTPYFLPTAATISGCLLAVGGGNSSTDDSTSQQKVYIYCPSTASWLHVSDLPSPRLAHATAMISPTEFLVIGGEDHPFSPTRTVYMASLEMHVAREPELEPDYV